MGKGWAMVGAMCAAGVGCLVADALGWPWTMLVLKLVPVALLIGWVARSAPAGSFKKAILGGLACSLVGDAILAVPGVDWFVPGLVSFLCAHLFYIRAFLSDTRRWAWPLASIALAVAGGIVGSLLAFGQLGPMLVPVVAYACVIATMLWRALARQGEHGLGSSAKFGALGAVVFTLSDATLAFQRFVWSAPMLTIFVLATYWLAQSGIAAAAVRHPPQARAG